MLRKSGPATTPLDGKRLGRWSLKQIVVRAAGLLAILAAISPTMTLLKTVGHFISTEYYQLRPIDRAEVGTFTVGVAEFGEDTDDNIQHLVLVDLQEIKWIRVLEIRRIVSLDETDSKSIADGHATALKYLKESGAQILVWGRVLGDGNRTVPELFISAAPNSATGLKHGRYPFDELFRLPQIFWQQLASILDLVVVNQGVRLLATRNPDMADALPPFIAKVKQLLVDSKGESVFNKKTRADVENALAVALWAQADVSNTAGPLAEAADILEDIVKSYDPKVDWKQLAAAKQTLGMARLALFRRQTRLGASMTTAAQQILLNKAFTDLNESSLISFQHGQSKDPSSLFDMSSVLSANAGVGVQQKAWESVDEAVGEYWQSAGMSPQERGTNGRLWVLFTLAQGGVAMTQGGVALNDFAAKLGPLKIRRCPELSRN
jgi:hypothetical protein